MRFADSHCHPHLAPLDTRSDDVISAAQAAGVDWLLCVSVSLRDVPVLHGLCDRHPGVFMSVGVHPNEPEDTTPTVETLVREASHPGVVAIGETGLDYYRSPAEGPWQLERFRRHIAAAHVIDKPLIIHTRAAAADTLRVLAEEDAQAVGGVMHCFTEDEATARQALDLGFYISFSGIVTFRNADALRAVARMVPIDRLLIETDSPYLAPAPHRGKTNEPALVARVAETLASVRGIPVARVAEATCENFRRLFDISGLVPARDMARG